METLCKESVKSRKQRELLLNKKDYVIWMKQNRELNDLQAKKQWREDKLDDRVYREEVDGKLCLAVKLPTMLTREKREVVGTQEKVFKPKDKRSFESSSEEEAVGD